MSLSNSAFFTPPSSRICKYCQSITIASLLDEPEHRGTYSESSEHHPSFNSLIRSARSCDLCSLFHAAIIKFGYDASHNNSGPLKLRAIRRDLEAWEIGADGYSGLQMLDVRISSPMLMHTGRLELCVAEALCCTYYKNFLHEY